MANESAQARIKVCADLLTQHTKIHHLSVAISIAILIAVFILAGLGSLPIVAVYGSMLVVLLGSVELVLAIRVGFDMALLQQLAQLKAVSPTELVQLDQALISLKLMPSSRSGRDLDARLHGCIGLLRRQAVFCLLQLLAVLCITLWLVLLA